LVVEAYGIAVLALMSHVTTLEDEGNLLERVGSKSSVAHPYVEEAVSAIWEVVRERWEFKLLLVGEVHWKNDTKDALEHARYMLKRWMGKVKEVDEVQEAEEGAGTPKKLRPFVCIT
jgi:hypothetical protein